MKGSHKKYWRKRLGENGNINGDSTSISKRYFWRKRRKGVILNRITEESWGKKRNRKDPEEAIWTIESSPCVPVTSAVFRKNEMNEKSMPIPQKERSILQYRERKESCLNVVE
ncbi:hypothetical protein JTB14_006331 [Gonioctena quinquepunctata]|nr:hypothetical protein JTB14_006331 [Gonioctena quinquepunctata]